MASAKLLSNQVAPVQADQNDTPVNDTPVHHTDIKREWYIVLLRWFWPGFGLAFCFFIQNVCLHVATHYYVQWMYRLKKNLHHGGHEVTLSNETLSTSIEDGALHDAFASWLGYHEIPMAAMDYTSGIVPLVWLVAVILRRDLHLWTKCCICGMFLALLKGVLGCTTIVPDSTGWKHCEARLGKAGVAYFKDDDNMNFGKDLWDSLKDVLILEITGAARKTTGGMRHIRYCADMVYSGHTYFVTLFALGNYDLLRKVTRNKEDFTPLQRQLLRFAGGFVLTIFVLVDVCLILMNRFHYTIDVILAVVLTLLFYTNGAIAIAVEHLAAEDKNEKCDCGRKKVEPTDESEFMLPPCCVPFCTISGRYYIHDYPLHHDLEDPKPPPAE